MFTAAIQIKTASHKADRIYQEIPGILPGRYVFGGVFPDLRYNRKHSESGNDHRKMHHSQPTRKNYL